MIIRCLWFQILSKMKWATLNSIVNLQITMMKKIQAKTFITLTPQQTQTLCWLKTAPKIKTNLNNLIIQYLKAARRILSVKIQDLCAKKVQLTATAWCLRPIIWTLQWTLYNIKFQRILKWVHGKQRKRK